MTTRIGTTGPLEVASRPWLDCEIMNVPKMRVRVFGTTQLPVPSAKRSESVCVPMKPGWPLTRVLAPTIAVPGEAPWKCCGRLTVLPAMSEDLQRGVVDGERHRRKLGLATPRRLGRHGGALDLDLERTHDDLRAGLVFDRDLADQIVDAEGEFVGLDELHFGDGIGGGDIAARPGAAGPDRIRRVARLELDPHDRSRLRKREEPHVFTRVGNAGKRVHLALAENLRHLHLEPTSEERIAVVGYDPPVLAEELVEVALQHALHGVVGHQTPPMALRRSSQRIL